MEFSGRNFEAYIEDEGNKEEGIRIPAVCYFLSGKLFPTRSVTRSSAQNLEISDRASEQQVSVTKHMILTGSEYLEPVSGS